MTNEYTSWWQYPQLLEPYEPHPYEEDGWHDATVEVVDAGERAIGEQKKLEATRDEEAAAEEEEDFAQVDEDCPSVQQVWAGSGAQGRAHAPVADRAGRPAGEPSRGISVGEASRAGDPGRGGR